MKLVVVTQQVDPASPVLGATVAKLRALAARVDELVVLADTAVEGVLPENCRVHLFRSPRRTGRGVRFESALTSELRRKPRPAAVLAHMCPIYAVLAAPVARPLGVDVLLWFTHWRRSALRALDAPAFYGTLPLRIARELRREPADALVRVLSDRDLAQRLGDGGHARSADWTYTADEYAERVAELVDRAMAAHS